MEVQLAGIKQKNFGEEKREKEKTEESLSSFFYFL